MGPAKIRGIGEAKNTAEVLIIQLVSREFISSTK